MSSYNELYQSFSQRKAAAVYWLQGEEPFFIDQLVQLAEHHWLNETEATFNKTVFYGKDADWTSVINACRKHPMFGTIQLVLLKEAQQMRDLIKLEPYLIQPLPSTIFIVAYKGKHPDKRTSFYKTLQKHATIFDSVKLKEDKIQPWIEERVKEKGLQVQKKAVAMLADHIGDDLSRIEGELEKLAISVKEKQITETDVETHIGISREYNAFELQAAIAFKKMPEALRIIQYFEANPKAGPIQMVLPALYGFFGKLYTVFGNQKLSDNEFRQLFYFNPIAINQAKTAMKLYGFNGVEKAILLLHQYNLKSLGIGDNGTESALLLKEMTLKIIHA